MSTAEEGRSYCVDVRCQTSRMVVSLGERCTSYCFKPGREIRITPGQETHPGFALDVHPLLAFSRSRWWVAVRKCSTEGDHDLLSGIDTQMRRRIRPGDCQASLGAVLDDRIGPRLRYREDAHTWGGVCKAPGSQLSLRDRRWLMTIQRRTFPFFPHTRFQGRDGDMGLCPGGLVKAPARLSQFDFATCEQSEDTGHLSQDGL